MLSSGSSRSLKLHFTHTGVKDLLFSNALGSDVAFPKSTGIKVYWESWLMVLTLQQEAPHLSHVTLYEHPTFKGIEVIIIHCATVSGSDRWERE